MTARFRSLGYALVASVALTACAGGRAADPPTPVQGFTAALEAAEERAREGDHAGADRILADFALSAAGTTEATEIAFWRALYMVDPANRNSSVADGIRALDIYLASSGARLYREQAEVLRRTAQVVQTLRTGQPTGRTNSRDTVYVGREDEIASLKEQLARANAELERIRRRLANPTR